MITEEALERQASIRIAIIDDDENSREQIKTITEKTLSEQNQNCFVKTYASAIDLLMDLENGVYYGAFLVDVEMPKMTGLELARKIQKYYADATIIFVTDYVQYSPGAFEVNAFRYIMKRDLHEKLPMALKKMIPRLENKATGCYIIRRYLDAEVLLYREIFYIKKEGKNVVFCHTHGESSERKSLIKIAEELPQGQFVEVSKGYLVNASYVMALKNKELIMRNGDRIPVARGSVEKILEGIAAYWNSEK